MLTGAGISQESGLKTFRDGDGLWEGYDVTEVATPEAWEANPELVLRFYNERRAAVRAAQPNAAHLALVELERDYDVTVITQNIDDLHERAGSSRVIHLHGEIFKSQSTADSLLVYPMTGDVINLGDRCELGSQLRPFIVWFGEGVPKMGDAVRAVKAADVVIVIGTSLVVYPAASLIDFAPRQSTKYLVDPKIPEISSESDFVTIAERATIGVPQVVKQLLSA